MATTSKISNKSSLAVRDRDLGVEKYVMTRLEMVSRMVTAAQQKVKFERLIQQSVPRSMNLSGEVVVNLSSATLQLALVSALPKGLSFVHPVKEFTHVVYSTYRKKRDPRNTS